MGTTVALLAGCNGDRAEVSASESGFGVTTEATQSPPPLPTTTDMESSQSAGTGTTSAGSGSDSASTGDASTSGGETGSTSSGEPAAPFCGDGNVDPGEACDAGDHNGIGIGCGVGCVLEVCGDGMPGPGEECDFGWLNGPESGCSAQCQVMPSACGTQSAVPVLVPRPVDIIVVIDNSGSMAAEIKGVQDNINDNFAEILAASGLDYRVILISRYGKYSSTQVCIEAPLSGIPKGGCTNPPSQPINNPGKFYHYSVEIDSTDSWCRMLDTFNGAQQDLFKFAPKGWQAWLRPEAFKIMVEVSDDRVVCSHGNDHYNDNNTIAGGANAAEKFDAKLRELSPLHFGPTPETRNYSYYSIVGLSFNDPADDPYSAEDPIVTTKCPSGVNGGIGHQSLSVATGALRFPLCDTNTYDALFQALAGGVIADATIACDFAIPPPPEGKELDEDSVVVKFTPMEAMEAEVFKQVPAADGCGPGSFYLDDGKVVLCPETCVAVQNDKEAEIEVEFKCAPIDPG
ncbi:hypothetical protein [Nannocystis bainbridge]|uniref:Myxococcus cysteine-rich repeat-containing protein n=1 Tax=Nannocystis bainbridge TaxID=2995303 RepID=A0ABT5EBU3_9BACT|nr:hypothetical protein [Nannocystis bainbridge]MDC0723340.1 hypothetical protein [Nannocystis bainbridge]